MSTPTNYTGIALIVLISFLILLIFRIVAVVKYYKLAFVNSVKEGRTRVITRFIINVILTVVLLASCGYADLIMCMAATIQC
jgi:hypothetical protein